MTWGEQSGSPFFVGGNDMGARGINAPWDSIGQSDSARKRERVGRFSVGGKGRRRTVQTNGIPVPQDVDNDWLAARGEYLQSATRYGNGATVRDVEAAHGMTMPGHVALVGARAKPEHIPNVRHYTQTKQAFRVRREDGSEAITHQWVKVELPFELSEYRMYSAKADRRDRIAREQVQAEANMAKRYKREQEKADRINRHLTKLLGG
jgi:hypothetical protein